MLTVVTLLFLTGLFEKLPEATLAAVVIAALIELVDIAALVALYRFHTRGAGRILAVTARPDFLAAIAALLGVLVFDTLPGLFIGIAVSLLLLLYRASRPHVALLGRAGPDGHCGDVDRHPDDEVVAGHRRPSRRRPACSSPTPRRCAGPSAPAPSRERRRS